MTKRIGAVVEYALIRVKTKYQTHEFYKTNMN